MSFINYHNTIETGMRETAKEVEVNTASCHAMSVSQSASSLTLPANCCLSKDLFTQLERAGLETYHKSIRAPKAIVFHCKRIQKSSTQLTVCLSLDLSITSSRYLYDCRSGSPRNSLKSMPSVMYLTTVRSDVQSSKRIL